MSAGEDVSYASARDLDRALIDRIANAAASSPHGIAGLKTGVWNPDGLKWGSS